MSTDIVVKGFKFKFIGQSAHKILKPKLSKNFSIYPSDFMVYFKISKRR